MNDSRRGETLSEAELGRLKPLRGEGNKSWRAFCPFHGSDKQRSLRVDRQTGRFQCFACEAWGYMDWAREDFAAQKQKFPSPSRNPLRRSLPSREPKPFAVQPGLAECLASYQSALAGSLGEEYLADRKIPLSLAQRLGIGYAAPGCWAHRNEAGKPIRDWHFGRLVFPHTTPGGELVNLYGRALGDSVPKELRHDHLPGAKGYFCATSLLAAAGEQREVFVCEGPFDALSLLAAKPGIDCVAIFGIQGWRHDWAAANKCITFALDADPAGQNAWRRLARALTLRGKIIRVLPSSAFGGAKDLNEAWIAGTLNLPDSY